MKNTKQRLSETKYISYSSLYKEGFDFFENRINLVLCRLYHLQLCTYMRNGCKYYDNKSFINYIKEQDNYCKTMEDFFPISHYKIDIFKRDGVNFRISKN